MAEEIKIIATLDDKSLTVGLNKVQKELAQTAVAANKMDSALAKTAKASTTAGQSLQNLGRIAQDAPFGFIGIQNNINPLIESFQRLKAETGDSGKAFKALFAALGGVGGIGLAVSIGTGLLTVLTQQLSRSGGAAKETAVDFGSLAEATKKAADEQKKFDTEITTASKAIIAQANDIESLKRTLVDTSNEYNALTDSVVKMGVAQFFFNQKSEATQKVLDLLIKKQVDLRKVNNPFAAAGIKEYNANLVSADKNVRKLEEATQDLANVNILSGGLDGLFANIIKGNSAKKAAKKEKEVFWKEFGLPPIDFILDIPFNPIIPAFGEPSFIKELRNFSNKITDTLPVIDTTSIDEFTMKAFLAGQNITKGFQDGISIGIEGLRFPNLKKLYDSTKDEIALFQQQAEGLLRDMVASTVGNLAEAVSGLIGGDAGQNVFGKFFKNVLTSLGDGLIKLGTTLLLANKAIITLKETLGKALGIPGSIAAIALGALIKGLAGQIKVPGFATGVSNFGGGTALVGERGPELVTLPRGSSVTPSAQTNSLLGGQMVYIPELTIRGQDMIVVFNRATQANRRNGQ